MTKKAKLLFWFIPLVAVHCARLPRPEKEGDLIQDLLGIQSLQDDGKSDSDKQPLPPTEVPPPTMPPMKSATITTATPPTPPTPGVVTVTSAPSHDNKYMKKIERLLFAILLVVTAIFTLLAAKFVFSAVVKLASGEKDPKYKKFGNKKLPIDKC